MGAHSRWGMSGQSIIISCPGSVEMGSYGEDETNRQAELGTAVHDMCEFAFCLEVPAIALVGMTFNKFKANKSMAESAQEYLDVLNKFRAIPTVVSRVEQRACISSIDLKRLWGTADYTGVDITNRVLYVGDYKNGFNYVEVDADQFIYATQQYEKGNVQCIGYGLAVLDTYDLWDKIDHVVLFIIQPNKPHKDGPVRSVTLTIDEMRKWHELYRQSHELTLQKEPPRKAGTWCKYCKARGFCSTRIIHTMEKLGLNSDFAHCTPDQLIGLYPDIPVMIKSLEGIKKQVEKLARQGHTVPDHKLVKGIAKAVCDDEDGFVEAAMAKGVAKADLYNAPKLKGKTIVKAIVGAKLANEFYETPKVGLTLVGKSDARVAYRADQMPDPTGIFSEVGK